jgi:hypothetical protein
VGGWEVGIYGNPRATKDIDFLIAKPFLSESYFLPHHEKNINYL